VAEKIEEDINLALFNIRNEIQTVNKDRKGYNYKYADLKSCHEELDPLLEKYSVLWITEPHCSDDGRAGVMYIARHLPSGTSVQGSLLLPMADRDPQKAGSAITYSRRYALAMFGLLTEEDDDAKAATKKRAVRHKKNKDVISVSEAHSLVNKVREIADSRYPSDTVQADTQFKAIGSDMIEHLNVTRLGELPPSKLEKARKYLDGLATDPIG